ncbi:MULTISPECIES: flagellar filament capping protein FliD [Acidobacterium]|uniref:Flagellar hook-associated protein 2 n=1 Tax=Acidobacterium capsulatum (strain ATCC 51196 / DSM 11244 / BCRC 80197 / JCM 7670 / NBRC 15755 / NCIMB 13165 / 161) TaxID=240015 RepID=C1F8I7_ACIC5|nr:MULTISPECIES: flagellar filament capping protein FliD [Acidobacterium]ACO32457.1 flagellar hook-associated protein 2 [Acidobacterium capsulatum ATCC 51196]HCT61486.1 flagellar hook protein [Acidobacterium sp.]
MSTVGLSFGSPTSGQGFDVTTTVNNIVTNLQAVETPWKNQLTSLQSQDTALTSIGTDLSALSTSLQALTDFQGVLAGKQGSSSDTSVLELTSAAATAVAGSHTIVVTSLAQTSSYYSNAVAATDTLSGSLSIQVGSGSAQTININSTNNTLSSLASAINSGSYGVTANVLTDSSGSRLELVSNTSGSGGNITVGGSLADTTTSSAVSFTQAQAGADAKLTVDGIALTSASNTVSNALPGVTFQLLSASPGTNVQVQITNDNTAVETAVSNFVTAYNKVVGDLNTQEGNTSSGTPEPLFGNPTIATLQQTLESALNFAQPANAASTSTTIGTKDTLSGSIAISVGGGTAQTVNVNSSTPTLAGLASAINSANLGVTASVITSGSDSTLSLVNATSGSTGAIGITSSLTDTTTGSAVAFGSSVANGVTSATQLGISVNNDGTLTLNSDTLNSLLNSNYQDVVNFLQPSGGYTSFGGNMTSVLSNLGNSGSSGAIYLALQENSTVESQLNTNISNEENLISQQKTELTSQLNQANITLQEIPMQLNQVNEMYSAITGYDKVYNG